MTDATPFDVARFTSLLHTRRFARELLYERSVGSTMDLARDAATAGVGEGTLAATDDQTSGRGRLGRTWISPRAVNLASTLLLRPPHEVLRQIAMIAPLAIFDAIESIAGIRAGIKWPNDVQIVSATDGIARKVAGILIETDLSDERNAYVLVGAGVNVNFDTRAVAEIRDVATSLMIETGAPVDREGLLASYMLSFEQLYDAACAGASPYERWRERLTTLGQDVRATTPTTVVEGIAEDVDATGALVIRAADGALVTIEAGDVTLRR